MPRKFGLAHFLQSDSGMTQSPQFYQPPFCPNPQCKHHSNPRAWAFKKAGFHVRSHPPQRVQRYQCLTCRRSFSYQTFQTSYWLKRPDLLFSVFYRSVSGSGFRQIARELAVSPQTVSGQTSRLGRHCLLFQQQYRHQATVDEPLVADGFESFEYSQYFPCHFHLVVGAHSHFLHAFTDSELRRKGRMTDYQKRRRASLEASVGRPDPKSIRREFAELLKLLPGNGPIELHTDEHRAYPRALKDLNRSISHQTTPSKRPRTSRNPLFPVNLVDLLIRHSGANHKRETIAFSKRRQGAAERLAIFQVWRNFLKHFSERRSSATPAQRLGLLDRRLSLEEVLRDRLFPARTVLPERLMRYYRREIPTRCIPNGTMHRLKYAF